jgi:hypothetical protein
MKIKTGFDRYFSRQMKNRRFARYYKEAQKEIVMSPVGRMLARLNAAARRAGLLLEHLNERERRLKSSLGTSDGRDTGKS